MSVEAKTVLLSERKGVLRIKREDECSFSDEVLTGYVEADPMLDLVERLDPEAELARVESLPASQDAKATWREVVDVLRTHGRLQ